MKTMIHNYTTFTIPGTDIEVELPVTPSGIMGYRAPLVRITDDQVILGYLADDEDCGNPLEEDDYAGHIYEARRHGPTLRKYEEALGLGDFDGEPRDPYAVLLDVYEHGGISYSLAGEGLQCRFDTAKNAAVWVPSEALLEDIQSREHTQERIRELAKQAAEAYTAWRNGDCYGTVVATFDKAGALVDEDTCWGYIGSDHAYEALVSEFPKEVAHGV